MNHHRETPQFISDFSATDPLVKILHDRGGADTDGGSVSSDSAPGSPFSFDYEADTYPTASFEGFNFSERSLDNLPFYDEPAEHCRPPSTVQHPPAVVMSIKSQPQQREEIAVATALRDELLTIASFFNMEMEKLKFSVKNKQNLRFCDAALKSFMTIQQRLMASGVTIGDKRTAFIRSVAEVATFPVLSVAEQVTFMAVAICLEEYFDAVGDSVYSFAEAIRMRSHPQWRAIIEDVLKSYTALTVAVSDSESKAMAQHLQASKQKEIDDAVLEESFEQIIAADDYDFPVVDMDFSFAYCKYDAFTAAKGESLDLTLPTQKDSGRTEAVLEDSIPQVAATDDFDSFLMDMDFCGDFV